MSHLNITLESISHTEYEGSCDHLHLRLFILVTLRENTWVEEYVHKHQNEKGVVMAWIPTSRFSLKDVWLSHHWVCDGGYINLWHRKDIYVWPSQRWIFCIKLIGRRQWGEIASDSPHSEPRVIRADSGVSFLESEVKESHPWGLAAHHANLPHRCSRISTVTFADSKDAVLHSKDFCLSGIFLRAVVTYRSPQ